MPIISHLDEIVGRGTIAVYLGFLFTSYFRCEKSEAKLNDDYNNENL